MVLGDQHLPLRAGNLTRAHDKATVLVEPLLDAGAAEHERAGVGGIGKEVVDRRVAGPGPGDPARGRRPSRHEQPVRLHHQHHLPGGADLVEEPEHARDRGSHGLVGVHHDAVVGVVAVSDGHPLAELTFGRLVPQPGREPVTDEMELSL